MEASHWPDTLATLALLAIAAVIVVIALVAFEAGYAEHDREAAARARYDASVRVRAVGQ
jgi:hypothetical protein